MIKKVLVVGGSGFLGSHVCDSLYNKGYKVRILDTKKSIYNK
jgi:nucleoside-diphosphate-sugar epimerase